MHPPTTQILFLASASLLALTSAGPLPTTTAIAIATETGTTSPTPVSIVEKRQYQKYVEAGDPNNDTDALGVVSPDAESSSAEPNDPAKEAVQNAANAAVIESSKGAKRHLDDGGETGPANPNDKEDATGGVLPSADPAPGPYNPNDNGDATGGDLPGP